MPNRIESDILLALAEKPFTNQRALAAQSGYSMGAVNKALNGLERAGYLDAGNTPTPLAEELLRRRAPRRAVILAAGTGMRMVPLNSETSKAFIRVGGEPLIERTLRQLHEAGITDIAVVVGFMKEQFEYLIDEFGVELLVNTEFAAKHNLHSLRLAADRLENAYIIPCDVRCEFNPYRRNELYSWYMVSDGESAESDVRVNRKLELVSVAPGESGSPMIGIAYLTAPQAGTVRERIEAMSASRRYDGTFWESTLYEGDRMIIPARVASAREVVEINTYEQLRELEDDPSRLKAETLAAVAEALGAAPEDIRDIRLLKKGLANRSYRFSCRGELYALTVPQEDIAGLMDRAAESAVYAAIAGQGFFDGLVFFDPASGLRVTRFMENARPCGGPDTDDPARCMERLRRLHGLRLQAGREFDLRGKIEDLEARRGGRPSVYRDYGETKAAVLALLPFIESLPRERALTHLDPTPENFLFPPDGGAPRLIDWELAAMQDPHLDPAMFCVSAGYDRAQADRLFRLYFGGDCGDETRAKLYAYIALCGLLWSNWCELYRDRGVEFGPYSLRQYRYAKVFARLAAELIEKIQSEPSRK